MKIFLLQAMMFIACQSAYHSIGSTPTYIAVVQEKMPGNIMADDEPNAHQRHFTRAVYVLVDNSKTLQIDSVLYHHEPILFETEKLSVKNQWQVGNAMVTNKPINLTATAGKTWWKISLMEGNPAFDQLPALQEPLLIYTNDAGKKTTWQIDQETNIAPGERY